MSRQYIEKSPSISDKYSLFSKSGQRLYKRINNNIKIINKSKVSNSSNNSKGSVALRRTELSNDKIYSREEQFVPINTSQLNADLSSLYEMPNVKSGNNQSQFQSQKNYRQRIFKIRSQKQLGTYSSKSKQSRLFNNKKIDKRDIQRLIMLQTGSFNNFSKNRQYQRKQRSNSKKSKENDNSKGRQIIIQKNQNERNKPIKSIKSSLKPYLTSKRKDSNQINENEVFLISNKERKARQSQAQKRQNLKQLQNKYQNYYLKKDQQQNKAVQKKYRQKDKQYNIQRDYNVIKRNNVSNQKERLLRKQIQERYIQNQQRQNDRIYKRKHKEYQKTNQYSKFNENDYIQSKKLKNKNRMQTQYEGDQNQRKRVREQNQYEKYYKQSEKYNNKNKYRKQQEKYRKQQEKYRKQQEKYRKQQEKYRKQQEKYNKRDDQNQKYQKYKNKQSIHSESSLFIRSKIAKQKNSRNFVMKSKLRANHFSQNQNDSKYQNRSNSKNRLKYSSNKQIKKQNQQYNDHTVKKQQKQIKYSASNKQKPMTQTFDSAVLSINSRLNEINGKQYIFNSQSFNTDDILQKIHIHLGTLKLIFDYCHQFKRMYEQTQNWDELIFLSFKKYYVERVKIYNYLKSFKNHRKHQSQRINQKNKRQSIQGKNIYSLNEINSQNNYENHFQILQRSQNPFTFPFCKVQDKQIKSIANTPQYSIQISKIQTENGSIYCQLQQLYNISIAKGGNHINMLFCDNFSEQIFILMLDQIDQLIPNLQELSLFQVAKIRLGRIVKCGILIAFINGSYIPNITQIITYEDIDKSSKRKKIKNYTCYDLFYDVFQKIVGD